MMCLYAFTRFAREGESLHLVAQPMEERPMASSHVNALQSKHAGLDAMLHEEMTRPAPDTTKIQQLKKLKLRLKEEIAAG